MIGAVLRAGHAEPSAAVTVVATSLALAAGQQPRAAAVVAGAVLAGQLSVGWCNDWLDAERDHLAGRDDKPVPAGQVGVGTVRAAALVALPLALVLSLPSGFVATGVHAAALGAAWAYNLGLKSTVASALPYALAFGLLPSFATLPVAGWAPWWATATSALLGAGAHFTNVLPDLERDARSGLRGLPHRLGPRGSQLAAAGLLGAAIGVLLAGTWPPDTAAGVAAGVSVALVVGAAASGPRRLGFQLTILAALAVLVTFLVSGSQLS